MASTTTWSLLLLVLFSTLTATTRATAKNNHIFMPHDLNSTTTKSRKRQEIIFLRDDSNHKRSREGETLASIENHGKSLSADGKVYKGTPKANNYDDMDTYKGPALKEQTVKKYTGPPKIQEEEKKSDAYEVVSDSRDSNTIVKVRRHHRRHHRQRLRTREGDSGRARGHRRSGLHIISIDGDNTDDDRLLTDRDTRLYGSIGTPASMPVNPREQHHSFDSDDNITPPSFETVSQDELTTARDDGESRDQILPVFRRHDPQVFNQFSQLTQPEELMQLNQKAVSMENRPKMLFLPFYGDHSGSNSAVVPITAQGNFPAPRPQLGRVPEQYAPPTDSVPFSNGLLLQSALQVPFLQAPSINPSFDPIAQFSGRLVFNSQQPDVRSVYQLQAQPQMQISQLPLPQIPQTQPLIIPTQMEVTPNLLSSGIESYSRPSTSWVDEDSRERSEVLDRREGGSDNDRSQDDQGEDYNEENEERRSEGNRYNDREEDSLQEEEENDASDRSPDYSPERTYAQGDRGSPEDEREDTEEPEDESKEDANGRSLQLNDAASSDDDDDDDDETADDDNDETAGNDNDDQNISQNGNVFAPYRYPQQNSLQSMQRFMTSNNDVGFPTLPMRSTQLRGPFMTKYQMMHPSSDQQGNNFNGPGILEPTLKIPKGKDPKLRISEMSPAEADFFENKATLEPNFKPSIESKDTIPGKYKKLRHGLQNVLIRLNGKPIEDSSQLRSRIRDGQIVEGKGKLIKSKGPVQVKLSHTKNKKHLKIIDIIAPKQFQVYDTKSEIRRPINTLNGPERTDTKTELSVNKKLQNALDNIT
ncbi:uncharacterized protein [Acropora muricata]|uniref:uncharacterized protein n=1 Tax=Acropora muricata TaxID=159855 RepID=UPI0034E61C6E